MEQGTGATAERAALTVPASWRRLTAISLKTNVVTTTHKIPQRCSVFQLLSVSPLIPSLNSQLPYTCIWISVYTQCVCVCVHVCPCMYHMLMSYVWIPVVKTHTAENGTLQVFQIMWHNHLTPSCRFITRLLSLMNWPPFTAPQRPNSGIHGAKRLLHTWHGNRHCIFLS